MSGSRKTERKEMISIVATETNTEEFNTPPLLVRKTMLSGSCRRKPSTPN